MLVDAFKDDAGNAFGAFLATSAGAALAFNLDAPSLPTCFSHRSGIGTKAEACVRDHLDAGSVLVYSLGQMP